jgi:hypothetical protein
MKQSLYKGVDEEKAAEVKAAFLQSLPFRKQLIRVLEDKIEESRKRMTKKDTYSGS